MTSTPQPSDEAKVEQQVKLSEETTKDIEPDQTEVKEKEKTEVKETPDQPRPLVALVIDDEPANLDFLVRLIQQAKFETHGAHSGGDALKISEGLENPPTLIIVDSELPDMSGIELIKRFREKYATAKIVMATMHDERSHIERAFENGCDAFLVKPHGFMELFKRLQNLADNPNVIDKLVINRYGATTHRPSAS